MTASHKRTARTCFEYTQKTKFAVKTNVTKQTLHNKNDIKN